MRTKTAALILAVSLAIGALAYAGEHAIRAVNQYGSAARDAVTVRADPATYTPPLIDCAAQSKLYQQFNRCGSLGGVRAKVLQRDIEAPSSSPDAAIARIP